MLPDHLLLGRRAPSDVDDQSRDEAVQVEAPVEAVAAPEAPAEGEAAPVPAFTSIRARRDDPAPPPAPVSAKPLRAGDAGLPEDTSEPAAKVAAPRVEPVATTPDVPPAVKAARASLQALAPAPEAM